MLDEILDRARSRLPGIVAREEEWEVRAAAASPPADFAAPLGASGLGVIAEIKRCSPSAGPIAPGLEPVRLARAYQEGGAAAISVLTEPDFFGGSDEDLEAVAGAVTIPVLRKDFILHEAQLQQARACGADAVLLIVAAQDDPTLERLIAETTRLGMAALVEAHDDIEVVRAAAAGAAIVGVNNRDLRTFEVDLATAERLRRLIPAGVVAVAESGITGPDAARRMAQAGYDAVLVGEAAARAEDPTAFIMGLREAT